MVFSVHLDSKINRGSGRIFADHPNITLVQPQDYVYLAYLMQTA